MLSAAQSHDWHEQGFVLLPGFKAEADMSVVRQRARQIVDEFEPGASLSVFSTRDQARSSDAAFLASAEGVHCFFEEEALGTDGRLARPKALAINKIGHALHDLDPVFNAFCRGPVMLELAADLGLAHALLWQSMLIFKQPGIGGEVRWHQDATFFVTEPQSVVGLWLALEDADADNGCLWVQPGGHLGPLREQFVRQGDCLSMRRSSATPWPDLGDARPLPARAGTLIVLHGLLPHCSAANRSARSRMALSLHITDSRAAYSPLNWLQRSAKLPVRGLD
jgi:phytanoyl-CoA hydroxylase